MNKNTVENKNYKWVIEPNPYDSSYDTFVTNDDNTAKIAIMYAAEMYLWDDNDGETRTLKVTHNP